MAVIDTLRFKRGSRENLKAKLIGDNKLLFGEPALEKDTGLLKIGDGVSNYADLPYFNALLIEGYYHEGSFYYDSAYANKMKEMPARIYFDKNTGAYYIIKHNFSGLKNDESEYQYIKCIGVATKDEPGLVKLYDFSGQNTDGAMTQKAVTDLVGTKFHGSVQDFGENESILILETGIPDISKIKVN